MHMVYSHIHITTLALFCALWFIAYKMEINLEKKFTSMKMPELKRFLQDRGVSVNSQLKPGLVAIACAVESMKLPLKNLLILIYLYSGITDIYSYIFTTFYCRYRVRVFHR